MEHELLAILLAIEHWHFYLIGKKFLVRTDHQALRSLHRRNFKTYNKGRTDPDLQAGDLIYINKVNPLNQKGNAAIYDGYGDNVVFT